jgi:hypothetical protein
MHAGVGSGRGLGLGLPQIADLSLNVEIWWIFMIQYIALQHVRRGNRIQHDTGFKPSVNYPESKRELDIANSELILVPV